LSGETKTLVRVFLGSPGDLDDERAAIRQAVEELNATTSYPLGYRIEVMGWEDGNAGYGRAQERINKDLETCEVFIGLMWKKWGTPPSIEGPYSSGFEEEYELCMKRRSESHAPEVAILFKKISQDFLADVGPELKKVIDFKQKIIEEKKIQFKEFVDSRDLPGYVRRILAEYLFKQKSKRDEIEDAFEIKSPKAEDTSSVSEVSFEDEYNGIVRFFQKLFETSAKSEDNVDHVDVARIRLVASILKRKENDASFIGTHDANILYIEKEKINFELAERRALLRSGLRALENQTVPIWSWYKDFRGDDQLWWTTLISDDKSTKVGAIKAIRMIGQSNPIKVDLFFDYWFSDKADTDLKLEALKYLSEFGSKDHLSLIMKEIKANNSSTNTSAIAAYLAILQKFSSIDAAKFAISQSFEIVSKKILHPILGGFHLLDTDIIIDGLSHKNADIKVACLEICIKRGCLSSEKIEEFLEDTDSNVRFSALSALDIDGTYVNLDQAKSIICKPKAKSGLLFSFSTYSTNTDNLLLEKFSYEHYSRMKTKALVEKSTSILQEVDYVTIELALRGHGKFLQKLRADFDDGFLKYQNDLTNRISQKFPNEIKLFNDSRELEPVTAKRTYKIAALALARLADKNDIGRIRAFIDRSDDDPDPAFVSYFEKFGEWEDLVRVFKIWTLSKSSGVALGFSEKQQTVRMAIVKCAVKISKGFEGDLLDQDIPDDLVEPIILLYTKPALKRVGLQRLEALLDHEDAHVRRGASLAICQLASKSEIALLVERYTEPTRTRYYNVTHWLDAALSLNRSELSNFLKFAKSGMQ